MKKINQVSSTLIQKRKQFLTPKAIKTNINSISIGYLNKITQPLIKQNLSTILPLNIVSPSMDVIIRKKQTHQEFVTFLHAACCSPVPETWIKTIDNNHFSTWPSLTSKLVRKYLLPSEATALNHMKQERQGLQSTKKVTFQDFQKIKQEQKKQLLLEDNKENLKIDKYFPPSDVPNKTSKEVIYSIIDSNEMSSAYSDLCSCFPERSSRGNNYILLAYHPNANAILSQAIKNRSASCITEAWTITNKRFKKAEVKPKNWIMDNECSSNLKSALSKEKVT